MCRRPAPRTYRPRLEDNLSIIRGGHSVVNARRLASLLSRDVRWQKGPAFPAARLEQRRGSGPARVYPARRDGLSSRSCPVALVTRRYASMSPTHSVDAECVRWSVEQSSRTASFVLRRPLRRRRVAPANRPKSCGVRIRSCGAPLWRVGTAAVLRAPALSVLCVSNSRFTAPY